MLCIKGFLNDNAVHNNLFSGLGESRDLSTQCSTINDQKRSQGRVEWGNNLWPLGRPRFTSASPWGCFLPYNPLEQPD